MKDIDQWLDDELRKMSATIPDEGFSRSVMSRLPPQRHKSGFSRHISLALATGLGILFTLKLVTPLDSVFEMLGFTEMTPYYTQPPVTVSIVIVALATWFFRTRAWWRF